MKSPTSRLYNQHTKQRIPQPLPEGNGCHVSTKTHYTSLGALYPTSKMSAEIEIKVPPPRRTEQKAVGQSPSGSHFSQT
jgi:hypothetical protein